ncbi:hypothetical protein HXX76_001990 [Chlamydomonas incerta]|uniref:Protein kinase domain-containing protein n=1 Tax=Chlamydomonas incerta TaxID=51695 RepID=A0A835WA83_CHLIN|nr:hypothetical protein HXX76_001990 [Chlamydomonas incerta]|eukprot:KAG2443640.1 hypothetical protein HXX76_001990 [Chlamydomonas incerta]
MSDVKLEPSCPSGGGLPRHEVVAARSPGRPSQVESPERGFGPGFVAAGRADALSISTGEGDAAAGAVGYSSRQPTCSFEPEPCPSPPPRRSGGGISLRRWVSSGVVRPDASSPAPLAPPVVVGGQAAGPVQQRQQEGAAQVIQYRSQHQQHQHRNGAVVRADCRSARSGSSLPQPFLLPPAAGAPPPSAAAAALAAAGAGGSSAAQMMDGSHAAVRAHAPAPSADRSSCPAPTSKAAGAGGEATSATCYPSAAAAAAVGAAALAADGGGRRAVASAGPLPAGSQQQQRTYGAARKPRRLHIMSSAQCPDLLRPSPLPSPAATSSCVASPPLMTMLASPSADAASDAGPPSCTSVAPSSALTRMLSSPFLLGSAASTTIMAASAASVTAAPESAAAARGAAGGAAAGTKMAAAAVGGRVSLAALLASPAASPSPSPRVSDAATAASASRPSYTSATIAPVRTSYASTTLATAAATALATTVLEEPGASAAATDATADADAGSTLVHPFEPSGGAAGPDGWTPTEPVCAAGAAAAGRQLAGAASAAAAPPPVATLAAAGNGGGRRRREQPGGPHPFMHDLRQVEAIVFAAPPTAAAGSAAAAASAPAAAADTARGVQAWAALEAALEAAEDTAEDTAAASATAVATTVAAAVADPAVADPAATSGSTRVPPPDAQQPGDLSPLSPQLQQPQLQQPQLQQPQLQQPQLQQQAQPALPRRVLPDDGSLYVSEAAPAALRLNGQAAVSGQRGAWALADFEIGKCLHEGYASSVFRARCLLSGHAVVLKVYNLHEQTAFLRYQMLRELHIHARLRHPNIVPLYGSFRDDAALVLVQQYVRGGSLAQLRRALSGGRMSVFQVMHLVLFPLLNVLAYMHGHGIVHRDIKPANLLFSSDWQLKLCDFGVSICLHEERAVTRSGSADYMAPEVVVCPLKRGPEDNKDDAQLAYTSAVDVWSLGVLVYDMLVGFTPFPSRLSRLREQAGGGEPADQLHFPSSVGEPARAFVRACLRWHPEDRPTVRQLRQYEWVTKALEDAR